MKRIEALNIYLSNKRKYLLITLNVLLVIFIVLEVSIINNYKASVDRYEAKRKFQEMEHRNRMKNMKPGGSQTY